MKPIVVAALPLLLIAGLAAAQPPAAPPPGPYQASCSNIRVTRGQIVTTLHATCAPSRKESSIPLPCVGEIINRGGELVCKPR